MGNTTIPAELVAINAIQGTLIADNAITAVHIGQNQVHSVQLAINSVTATQIADSTITSAKIADGTIVTADIADGQITTAKLVDSSVTSAKIAAGTIVGGDIANNAILTQHIDDNQITADQIADNAVGLGQMAGLARGSIIYGDSAGDPAYLAAGTSGHVLTSDGTDISWTADTDLFLASSGGTVTGDITLTSGTTNKPKLTITNTNADSTPPYLILKKDSASPADNDEVGRIYMYGDDDAGNATEAFLAIGKMTDVSNGSEDSSLDMYTYAAGAQTKTLTLKEGRVGVGTTSPQVKFHIDESSGATLMLTRTNANTTDNLGTVRWGNTNWDSNLAEIVGVQDGANDSAKLLFKTQPSGAATATRMTILSGGNVGIGNTNPATNLHIGSGTEGENLGLKINRGSTTNFLVACDGTKQAYIGVDNSQGFMKMGSLSNHPVSISQNNGNAIYIDTSKNVGIANAAPFSKLSINSNGAPATSAGNMATTGLTIHNGTGGTGVQLGTYDAGSWGYIQSGYVNNATVAREFRIMNGANYTMTLSSTGNVGIGTTNPGTELQIGDYTDNLESITIATASDQTGRINFYNANSTEGASMRVTGGGAGAKMYFSNRYNTDADRVIFDLVNGRVGIGTDNPQNKLHLTGLTNTDGIKLQGTQANVSLIIENDATNGVAWDISSTGGGHGYGDGALHFGVAFSEPKVKFQNNGSVGIGTNSAETQLHVKASNNSAGDLYTQVGPGNTPSITIQNAGTTDNNNAALYFRDDQDMRGSVAMRFTGHSTHSSELRFSTTYANNTREKVLISSQGQLGLNKMSGLATGGFGTPMIVLKQLANSQWGGINLEANGNDAIFAIGTTDANHVITGSYRTSAGYKPIMIGAAGSMRMRFDTNGRISMGDNGYTNFTSPDYPVHICADGYSLNIESGTGYSHFGSNNTTYFHIVGNRYYYFGQRCEASGGFHTYSDENLKKEITPITGALDDVAKMNGVTFKWKDAAKRGGGDVGKQFGVTAQNMLTVDSELPTKNVDPLYNIEDGVSADDEYYTMDYSRITPFLIEAVKELKTKLEAAEARIKTLEG